MREWAGAPSLAASAPDAHRRKIMTAPADVRRRCKVDARKRIACIAPAVAALLYPVALHALYGAGRLVHDATSPESALSAWTVTIGAVAAVSRNCPMGDPHPRRGAAPRSRARSGSCLRTSGVRKPTPLHRARRRPLSRSLQQRPFRMGARLVADRRRRNR